MPFVEYTPEKPKCSSPEHAPPGMIVLDPGNYTWECPTCGKRTIFRINACLSGMIRESDVLSCLVCNGPFIRRGDSVGDPIHRKCESSSMRARRERKKT